jgi:hypothetical protein
MPLFNFLSKRIAKKIELNLLYISVFASLVFEVEAYSNKYLNFLGLGFSNLFGVVRTCYITNCPFSGIGDVDLNDYISNTWAFRKTMGKIIKDAGWWCENLGWGCGFDKLTGIERIIYISFVNSGENESYDFTVFLKDFDPSAHMLYCGSKELQDMYPNGVPSCSER